MSLVQETLTTFKQRLDELETQIAPLAAEADELRAAIEKLSGEGALGGRSAAAGKRTDGSSRRRTTSSNSSKGRAGKAKTRRGRGEARQAVLEAAKSNPEATSGQIAEMTGIARNTVATTMSKLRAAGELPKPAKD